MPVSKDKTTGKWCVGSKCVYNSKEAADKAYKAYLAQKNKKKK